MKKLFRIWLLARLFTLITFAGAAQTDILSIDPVKQGNLCLAMLKGGGIDTNTAKGSTPVSVDGLQFSAVNYDKATGRATPINYIAQAGDKGMMTKDSVVWAVIHGKQEYFVTPKKISFPPAPVQNGGQQSSVDANAIMAYLQQKTDSLLQVQDQQIQQQANTITVLQKKIKRYKNSGGNNNQQIISDPNNLYARCFTQQRPDPRTRYGSTWNNDAR